MIAEIDAVLRKASPRLPWVMSGDVERQRRVLERVRSYLVSLQPHHSQTDGDYTPDHIRQRPEPGGPRRSLLGADLSSPPATGIASPTKGETTGRRPTRTTPETSPSPYRGGVTPGSLNQQVLQAVVQDLRNSLMEPIQGDLEALQRQRSDLLGEIRQLENQRQQYSMAQQAAGQQQLMREFLQLLTERLQESMTQQVAQILRSLEAEAVSYTGQLQPSSDSNYPSLLTPSDRLAQMRMLQAESDQLLMKLDSSIAVVFETLQRNINSYQESLSQGIDKMYGLGHQGEVMFSALINTLAEQLGREASSFVQSRPERSGKKVAESGLQLPKANGTQEKPESTQPEPELSGLATQELESKEIEGKDFQAPDASEPTRARKMPAAGAAKDSSTQSEQLTEALELLEKLNINQIAPRQEKSGKTLSGGDLPPELEQTPTKEQDADDDGLFDAMFGPESLATGSTSLTQSNEETAGESSSSNDETSINKTATLAEDLLAEAEEPAPEESQETARSLEDWLFASEEGSGTEKAATAAPDDLADLFPEEEDLEQLTETPKDETGAVSKSVDSSDVYIPASPEEDLLPLDDPEEAPDQTRFSLNPSTIQKLNEDLGNLEKEPRSAAKTPETASGEVRSTLQPTQGTPDRTDAAFDEDDSDESQTEATRVSEDLQTGSEYVDDGLGESEDSAGRESEDLSTDILPESEEDWGWEEPEEDPDPTWISLEPITQQQLNEALGRDKSQGSAAKTPESACREKEDGPGEARSLSQSRARESEEDGEWDDRLSQTEATRVSSEELQTGSEYVDDGFDEREDSAGIESGLNTDALPESEEDWGWEEPEEDPDPTWISLEPITQQQLNAALGRDKSQKSAAKKPENSLGETGDGPGEVRSQWGLSGSGPEEEVQTGSESVPDSDSDLGLDDWGLPEIDATSGQSRRDRTLGPEQKTSGTDILLMGRDDEIDEEETVQHSSELDSLDEFLDDNRDSDPGPETKRSESLPDLENDWGFDDGGVPDVESVESRSPDSQEDNEVMQSAGSEDISLDEFLDDNRDSDPGPETKRSESLPESGNDWGFDDWGLPDVDSEGSDEAMQSAGSEDVSLDEFLDDNSDSAPESETKRDESLPDSENEWGLDDWGLPDVDSGTNPPEQKLLEDVSGTEAPQTDAERQMRESEFEDLFADVPSTDELSNQGKTKAEVETSNMSLDDAFADFTAPITPKQARSPQEVSLTAEPTAEAARPMRESEFEDIFADVPSTPDEPSGPRNRQAEVKTGDMKLDDAFADFTAAPITPKPARSPSPKQIKTQKKKKAD